MQAAVLTREDRRGLLISLIRLIQSSAGGRLRQDPGSP